MTTMSAIRTKSILLTNFLENLLLLPQPHPQPSSPTNNAKQDTAQSPISSHHDFYQIITPHPPASRGAQLSIRLLKPGILASVLKALKANGIVVDARKPDVIRVAPAPLYNSFVEVWDFVRVFREVCGRVSGGGEGGGEGGDEEQLDENKCTS